MFTLKGDTVHKRLVKHLIPTLLASEEDLVGADYSVEAFFHGWDT